MSGRVKMSGRRVGSGRVDILRPERTSVSEALICKKTFVYNYLHLFLAYEQERLF
eukprot:UN21424